MKANDGRVISAGFVPLVDSAMLVVAREMEFAAQEGLDLRLVREASWANIRDKFAVGHFDVAHMLAPLPIAINLGLGPVNTDVVVPMELGLGSNAVAISLDLARTLSDIGAIDANDPASAANSLAQAARLRARARTGRQRLVFAVVHQFSSHFYEMAYWMAAAGLAPYRDIDIVVLPPPLMPDALASGQIDGFCAGEPWGTLAVGRGAGLILTRKANIWRSGPEKVLGVRRDWAEREPDCLAALIRALYRAAIWCDEPANRPLLASLLAQPHYVGLSVELLTQVLQRRIGNSSDPVLRDDGFVFSSGAVTFPWVSHALWFYSQMVRWGQTAASGDAMMVARRTYHPDIYRTALSPLGVPMPAANAKLEGALRTQTPVGTPTGRLVLEPDGFFDGLIFDPDNVADYINRFAVHTRISSTVR